MIILIIFNLHSIGMAIMPIFYAMNRVSRRSNFTTFGLIKFDDYVSAAYMGVSHIALCFHYLDAFLMLSKFCVCLDSRICIILLYLIGIVMD